LEASEKLRVIGSSYDLIGLTQGLFGGSASPTPPSWLNQALAELADAAYACLRNDFVGAAKLRGHRRRERRAGNATDEPPPRPPRHGAQIYHQAGSILDSALKLGKQGDVAGIAEAAERLDKAKRKGAPAGLVAIS